MARSVEEDLACCKDSSWLSMRVDICLCSLRKSACRASWAVANSTPGGKWKLVRKWVVLPMSGNTFEKLLWEQDNWPRGELFLGNCPESARKAQ